MLSGPPYLLLGVCSQTGYIQPVLTDSCGLESAQEAHRSCTRPLLSATGEENPTAQQMQQKRKGAGSIAYACAA
jgi:hypothetical protein